MKFSWFCLIFTNIWVSTISQGKVSAWNRCGRKIKTYVDGLCSWWQNYSGLAFCKSRGNSGVTASTSLHWKPQESSLWRWFILWANVTRDPGLPTCLVWGVGLAGCRFLCAGKYTAPLIAHEWAALSTRLMRVLSFRDPVHDLASARGHEWLATCVPVQDVLSQGILSSSTTWGISGCTEGSPACYHQLMLIVEERHP